MRYHYFLISLSLCACGSYPLEDDLFETSTQAVASVAWAEQTMAIKALGGRTWNCTNDNGVRCYNYSRGNHRLRLEDVNLLHDGGKDYWGTFTITNRRRWRSDPHIFVDFAVSSGKVTRLNLKSDGGDDYWKVIPDAVGYRGIKLKDVLNVVYKIGVNGNAQTVMGTSVWEITEYIRRHSQT